MARAPEPTEMRWRLAGQDEAQGELFPDRRWKTGRDELAGLELLHVQARSILNRIPDGSPMSFRWTVNPYRGCSHACVYCFARPTHEHLGLAMGDDFDRRLIIKVNAVERIRVELAAARWAGEPVALGTNTDPYQPVEGRYRLTRGVLRALTDAGNPFSVLTKSPLILRDADVLADAAERGLVETALSIATLDRALARRIEPRAPDPERRLEAVAELNARGIPCGVMVAPVLPGLNDGEESLRRVARAAIGAGAVAVAPIPLHLRPGVREHTLAWLEAEEPGLADDYRRRYSGAYLPTRERRRLGETVRRLVREAGGTRVVPPRAAPTRATSDPPRHGGGEDDRQLRLIA